MTFDSTPPLLVLRAGKGGLISPTSEMNVDNRYRLVTKLLLVSMRISPRTNTNNGKRNVTRDLSDIFSNKIIIKSGIQFNLVNDFKKVVKYVEEKVKRKND